ncbi:MAG: nucleotidyltransferase domain-containing protein [Candidatus Bipolaricaulaceae bacterium]
MARLAEKLRPQAVILFGSLARGDIHEGSDVDLMVIADFQEPFLDRIKLLLDLNDGIGLPLEPVGYTPEEFQEMVAKGNRFAQEVLRTGHVLFGSWALGKAGLKLGREPEQGEH